MKGTPGKGMFEGEGTFMWVITVGPFLIGLLVTLIAPKLINHSDQARALPPLLPCALRAPKPRRLRQRFQTRPTRHLCSRGDNKRTTFTNSPGA